MAISRFIESEALLTCQRFVFTRRTNTCSRCRFVLLDCGLRTAPGRNPDKSRRHLGNRLREYPLRCDRGPACDARNHYYLTTIWPQLWLPNDIVFRWQWQVRDNYNLSLSSHDQFSRKSNRYARGHIRPSESKLAGACGSCDNSTRRLRGVLCRL